MIIVPNINSAEIKYYFTLPFLLLIGCKHSKQFESVQNKQFSGYGVVFYHKSIIESGCELFIIPICGDSAELKDKIPGSIDKLQFLGGVDHVVSSLEDSVFRQVFEKAEKRILTGNDMLEERFHSVYVCPVYIEFKNAKNYTRNISHSNKSFFHEKFIFENSQQLTITYFLTGDLQVTKLRVL